MDFGKIDPGLRSALTRNENNPEYRYTVFIHMMQPAGEQEIRFLQDIGVDVEKAGRSIITAELPAELIDVLSDQPWVSAIRLSRKLKPSRYSGTKP